MQELLLPVPTGGGGGDWQFEIRVVCHQRAKNSTYSGTLAPSRAGCVCVWKETICACACD